VDIATPGAVPPTIDTNGFELYFYKLQAPLTALLRREDDVAVAFRYFGALEFSDSETSIEVDAFVARKKLRQRVRGLQAEPMLALEDLTDDGALDVYDGLYVPGGHAPKVDLLHSAAFGTVLRHFHERGKPTALICHAPVTLLATVDGFSPDRALTEEQLEAFPYRGYDVTIGNVTEEQILEDFLYLRGDRLAFYVEPQLEAAAMNVNPGHRIPAFRQVVVDRELLTGANPASTDELAEVFVAALDARLQ
jgi:putative intracellular protease/amidase